MFFWVYVLESIKDGDTYTGYTENLNRRLEEHKRGYNFSTKFRRPFKTIYLEASLNQEYAKQRECYLKSTAGRRYLAQRLRRYRSS
ncbi:MAG: GIY-YIG nuclease family protein [bacterium]|nr:GIY-YIG nuclease family protein [bacterium]